MAGTSGSLLYVLLQYAADVKGYEKYFLFSFEVAGTKHKWSRKFDEARGRIDGVPAERRTCFGAGKDNKNGA